MIYNVSSKRCKLSDATFKYIDQYVKKVAKFLPKYNPGLPLLELVIRKHKRRLGQNTETINFNGGTLKHIINPKTESAIYYDGTITLRIPKKLLVVHLLGTSPDQAIDIGFERLIKELETYKGKHFPDDSEYFDHRTIRKI